jgi:predicted AlkP superfamily phosphohydrolase/phosphomutase
MSPINFDPGDPPTPMSYPADFAGDLQKRLGPYRTLGWAEATWALNENRFSDQQFMDDLYRAFDDRAKVILDRVNARTWDVLVGVIESTDRVQHMMWRYRDPKSPLYNAEDAAKYGDSIMRVYRRADTFVGQVLERLEPNTQVMIVSDHGFHAWNKAVNVNTWLVEQGYMVLKGQGESRDRKLDDLFGGGTFWENVDWSKTRAYAMGLGQIYFNTRGREAQGIVSPGAESLALANELVNKLKADMIDPDTKEHIVRNVYKRDDVYSGEFLGNASDLQLGFEDGYRVSWQTAQGGTPKGIVYNNTQKWSGDHGGYDYQTTSGVLITNRPISTTTPNIIDIAPTVLRQFGVAIPKSIDGKPLWK